LREGATREVELLEGALPVSEGPPFKLDDPWLRKEFKRGQFAVEWNHICNLISVKIPD
jgi:hypothetical protein